MKPFKGVEDGEVFVVDGGFELKRVSESSEYNAVFTDSTDIGVNIPFDETTYTVDEFSKLPKPEQELLFETSNSY